MFSFIKKEITFTVALVLTFITAFFVHPSIEYLTCIDYRMLALLFCLMAISSGLKESGFFEYLANLIVSKVNSFKYLSLLLVYLVFFASMFITNDVALLVFVPFTLLVVSNVVTEDKIIFLIILETVSANLGSMATPIGNPQNLYLYSYYNLSAYDFFSSIVPVALFSLVLLTLTVFIFCKGTISIVVDKRERRVNKKLTLSYFALLILSLLTVFKVFDYRLLLFVIVLFLLFFSRKTFLAVDYLLLLTFVLFFIFSHNISSTATIKSFLTSLMERSALLTSLLTSQVISNVPSAVLLSSATSNWKELLLGVDIGGLGTLVASLASLISFKIYANRSEAKVKRYLLRFTLINFALLVLLYLFTFLIL
ncbi:MAG: citrate transporter [Spirochaetales bacterium]|nr:citrate transporter [Spirochaetales bacterium]